MAETINAEDTFLEISSKLSRAKGTITENNATTAGLITNINSLVGEIEEIIQNLSDRLVSEADKRDLITSLNEYISAAESASPNVDKLQAILVKLQAIKRSLGGQERAQGAEEQGQRRGGGRRTKKHKKSKSRAKAEPSNLRDAKLAVVISAKPRNLAHASIPLSVGK